MAAKANKVPRFSGVRVTASGLFQAATKGFCAGTWPTAREAAIAHDRVVLFLGLNKPLNLPKESRKLGPASAQAMMLAAGAARVAQIQAKPRARFLGILRNEAGRYRAQPSRSVRAGVWTRAEDAALARDRVILHLGLVRILNFPEKARALGPASAEQMRQAALSLDRGPHRYRGTEYRAREGVWVARLEGQRVRYYLGTFTSAEQAARAYDEAAWNLTGNAAILNFAPPDHAPTGKPPPRVGPPRKKSTRFYGVTARSSRSFEASLRRGGTSMSLGSWGTAQQAALAWDRAALYYDPNASKLNFPEYSRLLGPLSPKELAAQARVIAQETKSGYQGTSCDLKTRRWFAQVVLNRCKHKVGTFGSAEEAARARDRLWIHLGLPRAFLNFPDEDPEAASAKEIQSEVRRAFKEATTSRFRGVCYIDEPGAWRAGIKHDGRSYYLGMFESEVQAARAYDEAAARLHKQPKLNFPDLVKRRRLKK